MQVLAIEVFMHMNGSDNRLEIQDVVVVLRDSYSSPTSLRMLVSWLAMPSANAAL